MPLMIDINIEHWKLGFGLRISKFVGIQNLIWAFK